MSAVYAMTWPINDPDMPLVWLKAQAVADLQEALHHAGLRPVRDRPAWHIRHGATPTLTAHIPVKHKHRSAAA